MRCMVCMQCMYDVRCAVARKRDGMTSEDMTWCDLKHVVYHLCPRTSVKSLVSSPRPLAKATGQRVRSEDLCLSHPSKHI